MRREGDLSAAQLLLENAELVKTVDALRRENESLRVELECLRQAEAEAGKEIKGLKRIVFSRVNGEEGATGSTEQISFPYTVKQRVVIFGGHDSWSKAIRPLLRNVRFISKESSPQADVIRKADVVWIQTNALSHADYDKIMETARAYRIAVKYFTSASAERCARDVVRVDMK